MWDDVNWYGEYDAPIFKDSGWNGEELFTDQRSDEAHR